MFGLNRKILHAKEDRELLALIRQEESSAALGILYERYSHLVMGACLYYIKDEEEAQDLTSKIFEELSGKIKKFDILQFKSWLFQLVKNECFMLLRKKKHLFVSSDLVAEKDETNELNEEKEQKITLLEEAIQYLNQEQQRCIRLFYLEMKSYADISKELNMDLNKVKSYIQNGKRNLKLLLEKHELFQ